ncbi:CHASE2 domain-containing protein, partial [Paracraurococcus ruber]
MTGGVGRPGGGAPAGILAAVLLALAWAAAPGGLRDVLRERALDALHGPAPATPDIVVVDIDRAAIARFGDWPWGRARLAELLGAVAAAGPAAIGLDILLAGPDRFSPAALARQLGEATGRADLAALAAALPDGDARLAEVLRATPVALGFVLESRPLPDDPPGVPVLVEGAPHLPGLWTAPGLQGPPPTLAAAAAGLGLLALDADADGRIRRVPLLALVGDAARPGLAVEALRLAEGAGALVIAADPPRLAIGGVEVPLDGSAMLRLRPGDPARWA